MSYTTGDFELRMLFTNGNGGVTGEPTASFIGASNASDLLDDAENWLDRSSGILRMISDQATVTKLTAVDLTGANAPVIRGESIQGGRTSEQPVAAQVSLVWRLETGLGGRSHRGRVFWPFVSENYTPSGKAQWDAGHSPALGTIAADAFNFTFVNSGAVWAVNSRKLQAMTVITNVTARTQYLGSQRRRAEQKIP